MVGRIESYIHSDSTTPNKGGAMVRVTSQTDFAAKTDEFKVFSKKVAMLAYAYGAPSAEQATDSITWPELRRLAGPAGDPLEIERQDLARKLKEVITVDQIVVMVL